MDFLFFAILALAVTYIVILLYIVRQMNRQKRRTYRDGYMISAYETGVPCENITFKTEDGIELSGWLFGRKRNKKFVIALHGHFGRKSDVIGISSGLYREGLSVFLFDMRSCGESQKARQSIAFFEQLDLKAAIDAVLRIEPAARLGLHGFSMGAALALLQSGHEKVGAIVADSSFTSLEDMISLKFKQFRVPFLSALFLGLAEFLNRRVYGYSISAVSPLDAMNKIHENPILFIHGTRDSIIPASCSERLYEECTSRQKELWLQETEHCGIYFADRQKYIHRSASFFKKFL